MLLILINGIHAQISLLRLNEYHFERGIVFGCLTGTVAILIHGFGGVNLQIPATRQDGLGKEDLYRAVATDNKYTSVENVGAPVNSPAFEFNAFIAPDESYLIFGAQGRNDEVGGGDLYISFRIDGKFEAPRLLSNQINTGRLDYCPTVFEQRLYFTSERVVDRSLSTTEQLAHWYESPGNGLGDIYWVDFDKILSPD